MPIFSSKWLTAMIVWISGRRGVFTGASGLQVVYVSGREAQQEPAPAHCFTPKDLTALITPLVSNSKFKGVDILLTSQWPRGVWQYGNNPASPFCIKLNIMSRYGFLYICRCFTSITGFISISGNRHQILWRSLYRKSGWKAKTSLPLRWIGRSLLWTSALQVCLLDVWWLFFCYYVIIFYIC